ncbi:predicted protein [Sclerotinia sclerotiorum 1980 UF-70]|uniref:Uncharacterized protein n=1 Tax=Sclerotinia sclerotiorum (strain ATCC 18683 / 1980 / Ss-1) TaxID=665079 RepID=A7F7F1_SCLS1|nr:predicted protein [Sclerotinia sclerotiorum 1980 UF-70]EDN98672.1 predicted protein [Sclerotinia sclerotiorum 1980 UF-70]
MTILPLALLNKFGRRKASFQVFTVIMGQFSTRFWDIYGSIDEPWPRILEALGLGVKSDPRDASGEYLNPLNLDLNVITGTYGKR